MSAKLTMWAAPVRLMEDGTATLLTGASDVGQGSDGTLAQIVAEDKRAFYYTRKDSKSIANERKIIIFL